MRRKHERRVIAFTKLYRNLNLCKLTTDSHWTKWNQIKKVPTLPTAYSQKTKDTYKIIPCSVPIFMFPPNAKIIILIVWTEGRTDKKNELWYLHVATHWRKMLYYLSSSSSYLIIIFINGVASVASKP